MQGKLCVAVVAALTAFAQAKSPDAGHRGWDHHLDHHNHHHGHHWHHTGGTAPYPLPTGSGGAPAPTAGPTGTGSGAGGRKTIIETEIVTKTVGHGDHTTVITTTLYKTETKYRHHTVHAGGNGGNDDNNSPAEAGEDKKKKAPHTIHRTLTSTDTVYAEPTPGSDQGAGQGNAAGANMKDVKAGSGNDCAGPGKSPVTVTVTGPAVTVTVTASPAGESGGSGGQGGEGGQGGSGGSPENPPYPTGPKKHKSKCASTGFITKASASAPTGYHHLPSGTGVAKPIVHAKDFKY